MPVDKKKVRFRLPPYVKTDMLSAQELKQQIGWGISAFDLPKAWQKAQGEGVVIAVLDTGCDLTHEDLRNNLLEGINFIKPGQPPTDVAAHGCIQSDAAIVTSSHGKIQIAEFYNSINRPPIWDANTQSWITDVADLGMYTYGLCNQTGNIQKSHITHIHKKHIQGQVVKCVLRNGFELMLTPWHPVYVNTWKKIIRKRADELTLKDHLAQPHSGDLLTLNKEVYIDGAPQYACCACGHILKKLRNRQPKSICKKCRCPNFDLVTKKYLVDADFLYLLGLVMTDGHIVFNHNYRLEISSITQPILAKAQNILSNMGFKSRVDVPKNRCLRLICDSKECVHLLKNAGVFTGCKSYTQNLPPWIFNINPDQLASFIAGIIDGDGHIAKNGKQVRVVTGSRCFAEDITLLINNCGIHSRFKEVPNNKFGNKGPSSTKLYVVGWSGLPNASKRYLAHPVKKERAELMGSHSHSSVCGIKSLATIEIDEYFYDLSVEGCHNYWANGVIVSNTHVTGILVAENNDYGIVGVAPKAKVRPVKVLGDDRSGNVANVVAGIRWAADMGCHFICMSLGAPVPVQQVRKAIQYALSKGTVTFCAAGNAGNTKEVFYPANYPETIAIGAVDIGMHRAGFSNTGRNLDFMAPGVDIISTVPTNWYAKMSGTSMAAPFACGVAALLLSYRNNAKLNWKLQTNTDYIEMFRQYTTPVTNGNYADPQFYQGFGIIDPKKFMKSIGHT